MLCAISGESAQVPVVSTKSGNVFEKRLIEAYISENGKDPVTGDSLATEDLIEVKSSRIVRPRPPTITSIPSLLSVFQNEWDALALETYTLRQQLAQTRQELSTALYQHDAAVRVVARLMQERDEAREALSKITASGVASQAAVNGDEMQVDSAALPANVEEKITAIHAQLSAGRRKRQVPEDWVTGEEVETFKVASASEPLFQNATGFSLNFKANTALINGPSGNASIYSINEQKTIQALSEHSGAVTDSAWWGDCPVTAAADGAVRLWTENGELSQTMSTHAGAAMSISMHPSGSLLGSVGADKSYVLYDLEAGKSVSQIFNEAAFTCSHFHPDGNLYGAGAADSHIIIFDVRSNKIAANFGPLSGPLRTLKFSENGFWLAAASDNDNSVSMWDLRKEQVVKTLEIGSRVNAVSWDYTGQFLATAGSQGTTVQQYAKKAKSWSEPFRGGSPAVAVEWGANAKSLVTLTHDGSLSVASAP